MLAMFTRLMKSALFNATVFILGFMIGLAVIAMNVH